MNTIRSLVVCLIAVVWPRFLPAESIDQTYTVPIYVQDVTAPSKYLVYVSDGSAAVPYLFDTGSPNLFTVQNVNTSIATTGTFQFGDGNLVYAYYTQPLNLTLTRSDGTPVTPTVTNFNTAMVVDIGGQTISGGPLKDGTYGDFGAGLYGTSSLSTLLTNGPLGSDVKLGYVVDVAGIKAGTGALTIGLTQAPIDSLKNAPGAIELRMNHSADQIQTYKGLVTGYQKGLAMTTVTVDGSSGSISELLPTVFDTGGGKNGVIYYADGTSTGPFVNYSPNGQFTLTTTDGDVFESWTGFSPWGGSVTVFGNQSADLNRVNTGGYLFESYVVMVDLEDATLTLVPFAVPEIDPVGLPSVLAVIGGGLGLLVRRRKRA
jgi:hypothetical protein